MKKEWKRFRSCSENHSTVIGKQEFFVFLQIRLIFGDRFNRHFWDIQLKIYWLLNFKMLLQLLLNKSFISCLQKVHHLIIFPAQRFGKLWHEAPLLLLAFSRLQDSYRAVLFGVQVPKLCIVRGKKKASYIEIVKHAFDPKPYFIKDLLRYDVEANRHADIWSYEIVQSHLPKLSCSSNSALAYWNGSVSLLGCSPPINPSKFRSPQHNFDNILRTRAEVRWL